MEMFLFWLLCLLTGKRGKESSSTPSEVVLPPQVIPASTQPGAAPWPQVLPSGLPTFPGPGWTYDEPPPIAVQQRAAQLRQQLWKAGKGTHKIEQTAGRWIAYRAEIVRGGGQGVVAYRQKSDAPMAALPKPNTASVPKPKPPAVATTARSPGVPKKTSAPAPTLPTAPPVSSSVLSLPVLRKGAGMKPQPPNAHVVIVQQKLGIKADGQFWTGTETALRAFQRKVGLTPDAVVGPKTWTALFAVRA